MHTTTKVNASMLQCFNDSLFLFYLFFFSLRSHFIAIAFHRNMDVIRKTPTNEQQNENKWKEKKTKLKREELQRKCEAKNFMRVLSFLFWFFFLFSFYIFIRRRSKRCISNMHNSINTKREPFHSRFDVTKKNI